MGVIIRIKSVELSSGTEAAIMDLMANKATKAMEELGPHLADVVQARTPVSAERNFNPRSFQRVQLRPASDFPPGREGSPERARHELYQQFAGQSRAVQIKGFKIAGPTTSRAITRLFRGTRKGGGRNRGTLTLSPDIIKVQGNALVGAFRHMPGTLKRSVKFDGVTREGNVVRATVRAHAPYALAVHEGFTHRGGRKHQGKATKIKGRKFLNSGLVNVRGRLKSASTYSG